MESRESGLYSEEETPMNVTDPIQTEEKTTGKKRPKAGTSGTNVAAKKSKNAVNSAVETENEIESINSVKTSSSDEKKSINSASKGKKKRDRGRLRKAGKLPRCYKGKLIMNAGDLNTSEDTE